MAIVENKKFGFIRIDDRKYENKLGIILKLIKKMFFIIKLEKIKNGFIVLIPEYKKISKIRRNIIVNKNKKIIKCNNNIALCVSDSFKFLNSKIEEELVLDGKILMKEFAVEILEYIFNLKNQTTTLEDVYILVNEYSKANVELIKRLIWKFRTVNIITENMRKFKMLENKLYKEGILITVSSNKRRSTRNSKYVINVDFSAEDIAKYNINPKSIIINLTKEKNLVDNKFNGILINNFEIDIDQNMKEYVEEFLGKINNKIYLEYCLLSKQRNSKLLEKDNVKIIQLQGVRGAIHKCEFLV